MSKPSATEAKLREALDKARRKGEDVAQAFTDLANHLRDEKAWDALVTVTHERYQFERERDGHSVRLVYLAGDLAGVGRVDEALALYEQTRRDFEANGTTNEFALRTLFSSQAMTLAELGRPADAIVPCRRAVDVAREVGPEYSDYWEMLGFLADLIQLGTGDHAGCLSDRRELWQHFRAVLGRGELAYNATMVHVKNAARLAHALRQLGRWTEACEIYEPLIEDVRGSTFLGPGAIEIPTIMLDLADCLRERGELDEMRRVAREARVLLAGHHDDELDLRARAFEPESRG